MIFAEKTRIEEYIIELLDKKIMTGPALLEKLQDNYPHRVTKQAMYLALRKLLKEEVLNKTKANYSLNRVWLQKIKAFAERHTSISNITGYTNILDFEDGDSVTYQFKNPFLLDIIWGHLHDIIFEVNEKNSVMLNYHPHEWLILSRTDTESFWLNQINKQEKMVLFSIGGSTYLDTQFRNTWSSPHIKINIGESYGLKNNQYLSVIGDYIFEITTELEFEKEITNFFKNHKKIDEVAQKQIHALSKKKYKSKLKLSKNKKKTNEWRRKFEKDFYIPKPYYLFKQ